VTVAAADARPRSSPLPTWRQRRRAEQRSRGRRRNDETANGRRS